MPTTLATGSTLAGYRIDAFVGRGGMGVVYRATDLRLERAVALKLIAPERAEDPVFRERFLRESRLAASLEHPNVLPIYEAGEAQRQLFLAMRYVEGSDLKTLLAQEGKPPPERVLDVLGQVAGALDAAHARGLVHRDVKPANVLVDGAGHVYLSDFGLTKLAAGATSVSAPGQLLGTLEYLSPEQIRGEPLDGRADVYALGCVLYECMTGRPPFAGTEAEVLWAHMQQPPPRTGNAPLDSVIERALAKDRNRRYESCRLFVSDAGTALSAGAPTRISLRRRPLLLGTLVACVAAAIAVPLLILLPGGDNGAVTLAGNSVGVVDARSARALAGIDIGAPPTDIAVGEGAVWVTTGDARRVVRIDPETRTVRQTIRVGDGPSGISVGAGAIWVTNGLDGTVSRIDPDTNEVVQTVDVGNGPAGVAVGEGAVWVTNRDDHAVSKIDPSRGQVIRTIQAGLGPSAVAVGEGGVWVTSEPTGRVFRIEPRTGNVVASVGVGRGPLATEVGAGAVWVVNSLDATVSRIDPKTNTVTATIAVGRAPRDLSVASDAVWVSNELGGSISKIDPETNSVSRMISIGQRPAGIAVSGDQLFVAVRTTGGAHRGGTLTLVTHRNTLDSIDPALSYDVLGWALLSLTNDRLTTFKSAGGSEGSQLVPDLATTLPEPTGEGKTYTFQLRPGIRYSTGATVRPSDFRHALERAFKLRSPGAPYYGQIVGASACLKTPDRCDLSKGIVADERTGTVTFHLAAPDPEFPYKLALPFASAVPSRTPLRMKRTDPIAATGPYLIASYVPGRQLRLVRNPRFREWSAAAQPAGFPDEIVVRFGVSQRDGVVAVSRGEADVIVDGVPPERVDALRPLYAGRLHVESSRATYYFFLNVKLAPFDDIRVRRAVNYAVDRDRLAAASGGRDSARPTCQALPPNFPGYRPYCPYTRDLARARRLVAASGTRGTRVVLLAAESFEPQVRYFQSVLKALGYRTQLRLFKDFGSFFAAITNPATKAQAGGYGWAADFTSAGSFVSPQFTCRAIAETSNLTKLCEPRLERAIARALSVQTTDPAGAGVLWARVDRMIVDLAPGVFGWNPNTVYFVSERVGNYQYNPQWTVLLGQLWVR